MNRLTGTSIIDYLCVSILILALPGFAGAAAAEDSTSQRCASQRIDETVFESVSDQALSITCNTSGFWEANFGALQQFVFVPAGEFSMGSADGLADEGPVHQVLLSGYWIAKYPVTVGQFRRFVAETGYVTDAEQGWGAWQWNGKKPGRFGGDPWEPMKDGRWNNIYFAQTEQDPVGSVSWNDANHYAAWLTGKLKVALALPTEAQWEKAARGVDGRRFPWGNAAPNGKLANYADSRFIGKYGKHARRGDNEVDDGYVETSPVNAFPEGQSPYGVFDLAGNLGEWVYDVYDRDYYRNSPRLNPTGPKVGADVPDAEIDRVNRGGSWVDWAGVDKQGRVKPKGGHSIRSAARTGDEQNSSDDHMGFRLAIDGMRKAVTP